MKIKVLFAAFFLVLSITLSANETLQSDSTKSQNVPQANKVVTDSKSNNPDKNKVAPSPNENKTQQSDNNDISEIRKYTKETANNTEKGGYEWLTIIISSFAFIVAFITFIFTRRTYIISRKTLKSQEATRKNTTPIFTIDKQYEALESIAEKVINNYIENGVFKMQTIVNPNEYPSEMKYSSQFIDSSELHLELFYKPSNENDPSFDTPYSIMLDLKNNIKNYNGFVEILLCQLQEHVVDFDIIKKEYFHHANMKLEDLLQQISCIINYNDKEYFKNRIDIREHMAHYIWYKSEDLVLYWDKAESHFQKNMNQFKENNEIYELLNNMLLETKEYFDGLFKNFDFSKPKCTIKTLSSERLAICIVNAIIKEYDKRKPNVLLLKYSPLYKDE